MTTSGLIQSGENIRGKQLSTASMREKSHFLYYGLLVYIFLFFSQIAGRYRFLVPLRLEFVLGCIMLAVIAEKVISREIRIDENKLNKFIISFFLVLFITIPFAYVKTRALNTFINVFKFFTIYLMIIASIDSESKLRKFVIVYSIMNSILFVEPFFLSLQGKGFIYNNHMMRLAGVTGLFAHPNMLGMTTAANLPLFYYFMQWSRSKKIKLLCFILILAGLRVIMLTQSRTAFIGVITFIFLIWLVSKRKIAGVLIGTLSLVLIWQFTPETTKARFLTLQHSFKIIQTQRSDLSAEEQISLGSMQSRWDLIKRSLLAFYENPIIGIGLDCFASWNGRRFGLWFPPHNTYTQVLAETGSLGFITLLCIIVYTLKNFSNSKRILKINGLEESFLFATVRSFESYYLIWLVVSFFGIELYNNFWWVSAGLSVVILRVISLGYDHRLCKDQAKTI